MSNVQDSGAVEKSMDKTGEEVATSGNYKDGCGHKHNINNILKSYLKTLERAIVKVTIYKENITTRSLYFYVLS